MKKYIVTSEYENSRLDRWFRKNVKDLPQGLLEKLLRNGDLKLNGVKAKTNLRLKVNDIIEVKSYLIEEVRDQITKDIPSHYIELVKKSIIFEDQNLLIINKQENLAVQGGSKVKVSIDDILPYLDSENRLKLVHRLDKQTTGVLVIAKDIKAAQLLTQAFSRRDVEKKYLAILTNIPKKTMGEIRNFVKKSQVNGKERMVICKEEEGEIAVTKYKVIQRLKGNHCFVEFFPLTGRTHQLRLHAEGMGCSILGDNKYINNNNLNHNGKYLYLHSYSIDLGNLFDRRIRIKAELPAYFQEMISTLSNLPIEKYDY